MAPSSCSWQSRERRWGRVQCPGLKAWCIGTKAIASLKHLVYKIDGKIKPKLMLLLTQVLADMKQEAEGTEESRRCLVGAFPITLSQFPMEVLYLRVSCFKVSARGQTNALTRRKYQCAHLENPYSMKSIQRGTKAPCASASHSPRHIQ